MDIVGIIKNGFSIPATWNSLVKAIRPHGKRARTWIASTHRVNTGDGRETVLLFAADDILHIVQDFQNPEIGGQCLNIETAGEYYKLTISLPEGVLECLERVQPQSKRPRKP